VGEVEQSQSNGWGNDQSKGNSNGRGDAISLAGSEGCNANAFWIGERLEVGE